MKKTILLFGLIPFLSFSQLVSAETRPFVVDETDSLNILLSKDGTGIIKDISCSTCDFDRVKITAKSKASINGKDVNILQAKSRFGQSAMVSFHPKTAEVQYIRWTQE